MKREHWDSRTLFILAAVGSAVGLGNVWRFPLVCYQNGGGAFLIPFFIAIITAGIPLLILEMGLGHMMQSGAPRAMKQISKKAEWVGWFAVMVGFGIVVYYAVIMSWCFNYLWHSLTIAWRGDAANFFFKKVLDLNEVGEIFTDSPIKIPILTGLFLAWLWIYFSIIKGAKSVGKVVLITVPLPFIILIFLAIRGATLPGAIEGIKYYLTPDFSKLLKIDTWLAAYGQVFFSFSIGFGVMITYASFLPKKTDIVNNAFIVGLVDAATAFIAGFAVFSAIGFLSLKTGTPIESVSGGGVGLAFVTFPTIVENMPLLPVVAGLLFFIMLLTLGIDSAFSLVEAAASGLMDKWGVKRWVANTTVCGLAFLLGIIYTTRSGVHWLTITDYFFNNFGLVVVGLLECIVIGWFFGTGKFREHVNKTSEVKIGIWWDFFIKYFTPTFLIISVVLTIVKFITKIDTTDLAGYSMVHIILGGGAVILIFLIISLILSDIPKKLEKKVLFKHLIDLGIMLAVILGLAFLTFILIWILPQDWVAMLIVGVLFLFGGLTFFLLKIKKKSETEDPFNDTEEELEEEQSA